jgi:hypothetical protein
MFVSVSFVPVVDKFSLLVFVRRRFTINNEMRIPLMTRINKANMPIIRITVKEFFVEENSFE